MPTCRLCSDDNGDDDDDGSDDYGWTNDDDNGPEGSKLNSILRIKWLLVFLRCRIGLCVTVCIIKKPVDWTLPD